MQTEKQKYRIVINKHSIGTSFYPMVSYDNLIWERIMDKPDFTKTLHEAKVAITTHESTAVEEITILEKDGKKYKEIKEEDI